MPTEEHEIAFGDAVNQIRDTAIDSVQCGLGQLRYAGGKRFEVGGRVHRFSDEAWESTCRHLALPSDLLPQLRQHLGSLVLKTLHGAGRKATGAPEKLRLARNENGEIASVAPATLATLPNQEIARAIRETLPAQIPSQTLSVSCLSLSDAEFELSCHTQALTTEPCPGDVLHGGITIRHSQAGTAPTVVLGYIHRLVCSNGMTQRVCLAGRPSRTKRCKAGNSPARTLEAVKEQLRQAWAQLRERLDGMRELLKHRMDANGLPEGLRRRWSINREVAKSIAQALQSDELGRTGTEYDLVNALSRVATHNSQLAQRYSRHLSLAAGMFAQRHVHQCRMCGTWLADEQSVVDHPAETE